MTKIKKLGALAMAVVMCFALGITASAVDAGEYDAYVEANVSGVPHDLEFIDGRVTVTQSGGQNTVVVHFQNPAYVTVTINGSSYTASGSIASATLRDTEANAGYTASYDATTSTLTITCDDSISAEEFSPEFTFEVATSATKHSAVNAFLKLDV